MSTVKVNLVEPRSATTLTLGASGDTIAIPSGVTIANSGPATGFGEDNAPSFSAIPSGDQSIANATWVKGEFATEQWDVGSNYDTSNHKFVAPADGKYMFRWGFTFSDAFSSTEKMETFMYINGSGYYRGGGGQVWGGTDHSVQRVTGIAVDLSTDDYVEVFVVQHTGGSENLNGDRCFFQGFVLAGV